MKTIALFAAAAALAALVSGYPTAASARVVQCHGGGYAISYPCVVRGRVFHNQREYYAVYRTERRTTSVSVRNSRVRQESPCLDGYQWYPNKGKGQCIETHALVDVVEKAACEPGQTREVEDPSKPGGFRILTCGFIRPTASR